MKRTIGMFKRRELPCRPDRLLGPPLRSIAAAMCLVLILSTHCQRVRGQTVDQPRPNIVLILADDLSWSDLSCQGHPWHDTPHLDRLASQGLRLSDAYAAAPICSASRASILTGKTPARLRFEFVTKKEAGRQQRRAGQALRTPPFTLNLPLAEETIAERLASEGYQTAFFGKWHLNAHHRRYLGWSPTHGPPAQGFEVAQEDFGSHPYADPRGQRRRITTPGEFPRDNVTDGAIEFLQSGHDRPFFLMLSHFYVHTPVRPRCEWLLRKYDEKIPHEAEARERRIAYAAFVETMDHLVGRLLHGLDESGQSRQTLVVFTSDNGGHPEYTDNGSLRGSKWNLYEGGIRVPMIVRWPGFTPERSVSRTPVVGYDLWPTFAEVASGGAAARQADLQERDGESLVGLFKDPTRTFRREIYWHFPYYHPERGYEKSLDVIGQEDYAVSKSKPHSAIRSGDDKLIRFTGSGAEELYDLGKNLAESEDQRLARSKRGDELAAKLEAYLTRVQARRAVPVTGETDLE